MKLLPDVNKLESYYIPSRYGVDRFGKIHYRKYDEKEVETFANHLWISWNCALNSLKTKAAG
ncbi:MAG: hypothetical protein A2W30_02610 [Ignavibacteria bacterium RBG_16_36_9]|nr:MAG: hypothetical protein A2W30_02610 [Ignavibacteria bacterium RBG_16_36_9]